MSDGLIGAPAPDSSRPAEEIQMRPWLTPACDIVEGITENVDVCNAIIEALDEAGMLTHERPGEFAKIKAELAKDDPVMAAVRSEIAFAKSSAECDFASWPSEARELVSMIDWLCT